MYRTNVSLSLTKGTFMDKTKILQLIREHLENNINVLTESLDSQQSASDMDEGDTLDPEDYSQQSESRDKVMALQIQLDTARAQLSKLEDFSGRKVNGTESGALVETDKNWFYMGIALSSIKAGTKELYGISPDSPAYNAIKGKSIGDKFKIGNADHKIVGIF